LRTWKGVDGSTAPHFPRYVRFLHPHTTLLTIPYTRMLVVMTTLYTRWRTPQGIKGKYNSRNKIGISSSIIPHPTMGHFSTVDVQQNISRSLECVRQKSRVHYVARNKQWKDPSPKMCDLLLTRIREIAKRELWLHVCLSPWNSHPAEQIFIKYDIWGFFSKICR